MTHREEGTGRRAWLAAALTLLLATLVALPWLQRGPASARAASVPEAVRAYLQALQGGDAAEARRWLAFPLLGYQGGPVAGAGFPVVSSFALEPARRDGTGLVHVRAHLSLGRRDEPSGLRLDVDWVGLPTPAGLRLVAAHRQVRGWLYARDDRLWWQQPRGKPRALLALADLPGEAAPAGAPPGVRVATSRDAFGPAALLAGGSLLATTTGERSLVVLAGGGPAAGTRQGAPVEASSSDAGARPAALDVLRRAAPRLWQVDEDHRLAALAVTTEGGAQTFVVYGLTPPYPVFSPPSRTFPPGDYDLVPAGWHQGDLLFDARPRRTRSSLLDRSLAEAGRWRLQVSSGRVTRWGAPTTAATGLP